MSIITGAVKLGHSKKRKPTKLCSDGRKKIIDSQCPRYCSTGIPTCFISKTILLFSQSHVLNYSSSDYIVYLMYNFSNFKQLQGISAEDMKDLFQENLPRFESHCDAKRFSYWIIENRPFAAEDFVTSSLRTPAAKTSL